MRSSNKVRSTDFRFIERDFAPYNTLIQLPTARHNNAAHLIALPITSEFPSFSTGGDFAVTRAYVTFYTKLKCIQIDQNVYALQSCLRMKFFGIPQKAKLKLISIQSNTFYFDFSFLGFDLISIERVDKAFPFLV